MSRDLVRYPITTDEIIECLRQHREAIRDIDYEQGVCGDIDDLLMMKAIRIIEAVKDQPQIAAILKTL